MESTSRGTGGSMFARHGSHCAIAGEVLTFGTGDTGQLGLGEVMERKKPAIVKIQGQDSHSFTQVCCGGMHTIALSKTGSVFAWGCNDEGSLGRLADDGSPLTEEEDCSVPGEVIFPDGTSPIVQLSAGDSHSAALTADGKVFFWGGWRDNSGIMTDKYPDPQLIPLPQQIVKIVSGFHHLLFLAVNGQVYSMGCGENGQLGRLSERFATRNARHWRASLMTPALVPLKYATKKGLRRGYPDSLNEKTVANNVWAGGFTSMVQLQSGHVLGFGLNSSSQLATNAGGKGEAACEFQPKFLHAISKLEVREISCGHHHSLILTRTGDVFACGLKEYGALGFGGTMGVVVDPMKVDIDGAEIEAVSAGTHLSFAVTRSGLLYSWGSGTNNSLGHGDEVDKETPSRVTSKNLERLSVVSVSAGGQHSAIIATNNDT